jgi:vacuolar-type H+-ATPase subunit D/Vma8
MKAKLKGAETGHSLLKRKSEALTKYVLFFSLALVPLSASETNIYGFQAISR